MYQIRLNKTTKDVQLKQVQNNIRLEQKLSKISLKQTGRVGASAYQVWLNQGNTGSEADYLASLKGEQGIQGPQGPKGDDGIVQSIVAGANVTVDDSDPANPVISASGGGGGGGSVDSVNGKTGVVVLNTDDIQDTITNRYTNDSDVLRLANTSGVNTGDQDLSSYALISSLADVATSGDYADLDNKPIIPGSLGDLSGTSDDVTEGSVSLYMTSLERSKLSGIEAGAEVNTVNSVNTQTGTVVLDADDIDDTSTTHKFATSTQLNNADSAIQPGDNISELTNDSGFTSNTGTVTSVGITGTDGIEVDSGSPVTTSGSIQLGLSATVQGQLSDASTAVQPGDLATVATTGDYDDLTNKPTIPSVPSTIVESIQSGANITVDSADPSNPIISSTGGGGTHKPMGYNYTLPSLGWWHLAGNPIGGLTDMSLTLTRMLLIPLEIDTPAKISGFSIRVTSAGVGGVVRLGIYSPTSEGGPGNLVAGTETTIATDNTGIIEELITPVQLDVGRHWVALVNQGATASIRGATQGDIVPSQTTTFILPSGSATRIGFRGNNTGGSLQSTQSISSTTDANIPLIAVKIEA